MYGLLSIVGGKLTTYRNLAEQTVSAVGRLLGARLPASTTGSSRLPGAPASFGAFARDFQAERPAWLSERSASYLVFVYGTRAAKVVAMAEAEPALRDVVSPRTGLIAAAIAFSFTDEHASTLTDAIMRRTMIGYAADAGFDALGGVARTLRDSLAWDDQRLEHELTSYRKYMTRFLPRSMPADGSEDPKSYAITI